MQYNYDREINKCSSNPAVSYLILKNDGYLSKPKLLQSSKCSSWFITTFLHLPSKKTCVAQPEVECFYNNYSKRIVIAKKYELSVQMTEGFSAVFNHVDN